MATQLLQFTGLVFAGGLLLLWVGYNMYRELQHFAADCDCATIPIRRRWKARKRTKSFMQAAIQITLAGSVDEPRQCAAPSPRSRAITRPLLFIGLCFSVMLKGIAATTSPASSRRYQLGQLGSASLVILYVACSHGLRGLDGR